jgi:hypothetical protein
MADPIQGSEEQVSHFRLQLQGNSLSPIFAGDRYVGPLNIVLLFAWPDVHCGRQIDE